MLFPFKLGVANTEKYLLLVIILNNMTAYFQFLPFKRHGKDSCLLYNNNFKYLSILFLAFRLTNHFHKCSQLQWLEPYQLLLVDKI